MQKIPQIPQMLAVDIDATQKVFDAAAELLIVIMKGNGIISYLSTIPSIIGAVSNIQETKGELKDLNALEIDTLAASNISEKCKMFGILQGKSKYGIQNILLATHNVAQVVLAIKRALKDGYQQDDLKYLPGIFELLMPLYIIRETIMLEATDIQGQELEDIFRALHSYIFWIINN